MSAFPRFQFSMNEVKRAGESLCSDIPWDETRRDELPSACPRRLNTKLDQIQDLGGYRAVLRSIADAKKLFEFYQTASKHHLHRPTDYIAHPSAFGD